MEVWTLACESIFTLLCWYCCFWINSLQFGSEALDADISVGAESRWRKRAEEPERTLSYNKTFLIVALFWKLLLCVPREKVALIVMVGGREGRHISDKVGGAQPWWWWWWWWWRKVGGSLCCDAGCWLCSGLVRLQNGWVWSNKEKLPAAQKHPQQLNADSLTTHCTSLGTQKHICGF